MGIKKNVEDQNTGAIAQYHVINGIATDKLSNVTVITVTSFASEDAYNTTPRKNSMGVEQIVLQTVVPNEVDMWAWAYGQITDAKNVEAFSMTDKFVGGKKV